MKTIYKYTLLVLTLLFIDNGVYAAYCNTPASTVAITPTGAAQNTTTYSSGRRAFTFNATAGCTYSFSTCGNTSQDTYLRLYSGNGGTLLVSADDQCGLQSSITWVCTTTGAYSVLLTRYSCNNLNTNTFMTYSVSCPSGCTQNSLTLTMNDSWGDGWNGGSITLTNNSGGSYGPYSIGGASGSQALCLPDGCYSINQVAGSYPGEITWSLSNGVNGNGNYGSQSNVFTLGSGSCGPVTGCMNPASSNYNPLATVDDGSCYFAVPQTGSNSLTECTGSLYDNGGPGNYANNSNGYTVLYPSAGNSMQLTGTHACENNYDYLYIYDGVGITGTLLYSSAGTGSGTVNIGTITSLSGPLTVQFTSDGSVFYAGFDLSLACVTPPPPPANDDCANAQSIAIQCPAAATAVSGTTANATEEAMADPSCDPGTIQDVWYTFNSGNNSSVDLSVTLGTASWLGGEIHTTCGNPAPGLTIGGNAGNCDFYLLNPAPTNISGLTPNTDYRLRLFNNVDWDIAGTFTFTLTNTGNSTAPAITLMPGTYCPNTDITLSAAGGTSGAGAVINWYSGANGTGTLLGTGGSVVVAPTATTTYYVRREGLCNNSADDAITINTKNFVYAANGTSASNYCTDNNGWNHFYNGDDIIFSVEGDLSGAPLGYPIATINNNSAFYQETEGPGTAPGCVNNENPNEERFEMSRSWNLDFGGGTQNGTYKIRFYYPPAEKTAIENAANAWMANYVFCSYDYKYPLEPFYWFKNTTSNYTAPDYDGDHYSATVSSTNSGINYSEWNNITSFSGGSGAIIVLPSNTLLPVELVDFSSRCMDGDVAIEWSTASENNSMHFEVESSVDAFNWEAIAVVDAAQFSTSLIDYAILHEGAAREKNYYRLKQVDTDGAYEYYSIIYSDCGSDFDGAPIIFPNPSKNNFTIDFGGSGMKGIVQLTLVSMEGKEISNRQLNLGEGVSTFQINNLELQPGLYLIKMTDVTGKLFIIKHRFN